MLDIIGDLIGDALTGSGCLGRTVRWLVGVVFLVASGVTALRAFSSESLTFVLLSFSGALLSVGLLFMTSDYKSKRARVLGFGFVGFFFLTVMSVLLAGMTGRL